MKMNPKEHDEYVKNREKTNQALRDKIWNKHAQGEKLDSSNPQHAVLLEKIYNEYSKNKILNSGEDKWLKSQSMKKSQNKSTTSKKSVLNNVIQSNYVKSVPDTIFKDDVTVEDGDTYKYSKIHTPEGIKEGGTIRATHSEPNSKSYFDAFENHRNKQIDAQSRVTGMPVQTVHAKGMLGKHLIEQKMKEQPYSLIYKGTDQKNDKDAYGRNLRQVKIGDKWAQEIIDENKLSVSSHLNQPTLVPKGTKDEIELVPQVQPSKDVKYSIDIGRGQSYGEIPNEQQQNITETKESATEQLNYSDPTMHVVRNKFDPVYVPTETAAQGGWEQLFFGSPGPAAAVHQANVLNAQLYQQYGQMNSPNVQIEQPKLLSRSTSTMNNALKQQYDIKNREQQYKDKWSNITDGTSKGLIRYSQVNGQIQEMPTVVYEIGANKAGEQLFNFKPMNMEIPSDVWNKAKEYLGNNWSSGHQAALKEATNGALSVEETQQGALITSKAGVVIPYGKYDEYINTFFEALQKAYNEKINQGTQPAKTGNPLADILNSIKPK